MSLYPASFERLTDCLRRLPGIGAKSAQRMAFWFLSLSDAEAEDFAAAIVEAKHSLHRCKVCQNLTDEDTCGICASMKRRPWMTSAPPLEKSGRWPFAGR